MSVRGALPRPTGNTTNQQIGKLASFGLQGWHLQRHTPIPRVSDIISLSILRRFSIRSYPYATSSLVLSWAFLRCPSQSEIRIAAPALEQGPKLQVSRLHKRALQTALNAPTPADQRRRQVDPHDCLKSADKEHNIMRVLR
jgi:hypothetical protein